MKISTLRFGEIEVSEAEILVFPEGLVGMSQCREFVLLAPPEGGPFEWLQSAQIPALAFLVTDPVVFFPDYRVPVRREDLEPVGLEDPGQAVVRVILTLGARVEETTANLKGPLVINPKGRRARQLVVAEPDYPTRQPLFPEGVGGGPPCSC